MAIDWLTYGSEVIVSDEGATVTCTGATGQNGFYLNSLDSPVVLEFKAPQTDWEIITLDCGDPAYTSLAFILYAGLSFDIYTSHGDTILTDSYFANTTVFKLVYDGSSTIDAYTDNVLRCSFSFFSGNVLGSAGGYFSENINDANEFNSIVLTIGSGSGSGSGSGVSGCSGYSGSSNNCKDVTFSGVKPDPYFPPDYHDYSSNQGVMYDQDNYRLFGYSDPANTGKSIPVIDIIIKAKNDLAENAEALKSGNLVPKTGTKTDIVELFKTYGLDITKSADHETITKLQKFEAENASSKMITQLLLDILKPLDDSIDCISQQVTRIMLREAGETISKYALVSVQYDMELKEKVFEAQCYPLFTSVAVLESIPIPAIGMAMNAAETGECVVVLLSGIVKDYRTPPTGAMVNTWEPAVYAEPFKDYIGRTFFLNSVGTLAPWYPTFYIGETSYLDMIMQKIGTAMDETTLDLTIHQPVMRHWHTGE